MDKKPTKFRKVLRYAGLIIGILAVINIFAFDLFMFLSSEESNCSGNVASISLQGSIVSYNPPESFDSNGTLIIDETASKDVVSVIQDAEKDENVKAIVLEIDSTGGTPVAAEEIAVALKAAKKPTVALIREYGDSAAYWAATGADRIFASKNSDVGGIGITMSYLDYSKKNTNEGITYQQISSGKLKDAGSPDKPLTDEERKYFERDVEILNENFIKTVADNRSLDIEKVRKLADGSSMLGQMALDNGLIDEIGGMPEVKKFLESKYKILSDVCKF